MRSPFARPETAAPAAVRFTLRGTLTLYGRTMPQVQYVTDRYVITQVDRGMFIFLPERAERFLVDRAASKLRRIEPDAQGIRVDRLRAVIGEVEVATDPGPVERGPYRCTRYRFENSSARLVIAGETLAARIPGIEATALHAEREHDARQQPFSLPLEPDHVVVESRLRTVAADFEQNQSYRLDAVEPGIADTAELDRVARLGIIA